MAYEMAAQGLGIALGRTCLATKQLQEGRLRRIDNYCELNAPEGFVIRLTDSGQHNELAEVFFAMHNQRSINQQG